MIISAVFNLRADLDYSQDISVITGYDSNIYYNTDTKVSDIFLKMDPKGSITYDQNNIFFKTGGGLDYRKYFGHSNQSSLGWDAWGEVKVVPEQNSSVLLSNRYYGNSDPAFSDTDSRRPWIKHDLRIVADYKSKISFWGMEGYFESFGVGYRDDAFTNLDNVKRYFTLVNKFQFFPETTLLIGLKTGYSYYPAGFGAQPYGLSNSIHYEFYVGLKGRLNNTVKINAKGGFLYLDYAYGTQFHEPVLSLEFTDQFSPSHSVTAGFERMAYDSTYSNFYVDQKLFMDFKSLWWDNFVSLTRIQYIYRAYWYYPKRLDHRLGFVSDLAVPFVMLKSLKSSLSFITTVLAEWVNSDAYNMELALYNGPERSVSYKRFVLMFGLTTRY
jgi:hypothetical protein